MVKTPLSPHYIVNKRFTISILHDRVSPNSRHCVPTASSIFAMAFQITKKKRKRSHSGIDMGGKQYSWNKAKHVQLWLGCSQGLLAAFFLGFGRDVHHYRHHHRPSARLFRHSRKSQRYLLPRRYLRRADLGRLGCHQQILPRYHDRLMKKERHSPGRCP